MALLTPLVDLFTNRWGNAALSPNGTDVLKHQADWKSAVAVLVILGIWFYALEKIDPYNSNRYAI